MESQDKGALPVFWDLYIYVLISMVIEDFDSVARGIAN